MKCKGVTFHLPWTWTRPDVFVSSLMNSIYVQTDVNTADFAAASDERLCINRSRLCSLGFIFACFSCRLPPAQKLGHELKLSVVFI